MATSAITTVGGDESALSLAQLQAQRRGFNPNLPLNDSSSLNNFPTWPLSHAPPSRRFICESCPLEVARTCKYGQLRGKRRASWPTIPAATPSITLAHAVQEATLGWGVQDIRIHRRAVSMCYKSKPGTKNSPSAIPLHPTMARPGLPQMIQETRQDHSGWQPCCEKKVLTCNFAIDQPQELRLEQ